MKNYGSSFKSYDIRSIYNDPVDVHFAWTIGTSLGKYLLSSFGERATCLVGADGREANNVLMYAFVRGLQAGGVTQICNVGQEGDSVEGQRHPWGVCSSSVLYALTYEDFDLGVVFTASHNPKEYVGMKTVTRDGLIMPTATLQGFIDDYQSFDQSITNQSIADLVDDLQEQSGQLYSLIALKWNRLFGEMNQKAKKMLTSPLHIVIDYANGATVSYERAIIHARQDAGLLKITEICSEIDSEFSQHSSDTSNPKDFAMVSKAVKEHGADCGIMFDGDGDRMGVVDEQGDRIQGDTLVALLCKNILKTAPQGSKIVYDVTSTNAISEAIEEQGSIPVPCRVGHTHVKKKMQEVDAVFSGELSGHIFFPEVGGGEFPVLALLHLLEQMIEAESLSTLVSSLQRYTKPPLRNYTVQKKDELLELVTNHRSDLPQDTTDGVRIEMKEGRVLLRKSNTEPIIRCYVEGTSLEFCEKIYEQVESMIDGL